MKDFVLVAGADGEVTQQTLEQWQEKGAEVTKLDLHALLAGNQTLEELSNRIAEAAIAQDFIHFIIEGNHLSRDEVSYVPSIMFSLIEAAKLNRVKKMSVFITDHELHHLPYDPEYRTRCALEESGLDFDFEIKKKVVTEYNMIAAKSHGSDQTL